MVNILTLYVFLVLATTVSSSTKSFEIMHWSLFVDGGIELTGVAIHPPLLGSFSLRDLVLVEFEWCTNVGVYSDNCNVLSSGETNWSNWVSDVLGNPGYSYAVFADSLCTHDDFTHLQLGSGTTQLANLSSGPEIIYSIYTAKHPDSSSMDTERFNRAIEFGRVLESGGNPAPLSSFLQETVGSKQHLHDHLGVATGFIIPTLMTMVSPQASQRVDEMNTNILLKVLIPSTESQLIGENDRMGTLNEAIVKDLVYSTPSMIKTISNALSSKLGLELHNWMTPLVRDTLLERINSRLEASIIHEVPEIIGRIAPTLVTRLVGSRASEPLTTASVDLISHSVSQSLFRTLLHSLSPNLGGAWSSSKSNMALRDELHSSSLAMEYFSTYYLDYYANMSRMYPF